MSFFKCTGKINSDFDRHFLAKLEVFSIQVFVQVLTCREESSNNCPSMAARGHLAIDKAEDYCSAVSVDLILQVLQKEFRQLQVVLNS